MAKPNPHRPNQPITPTNPQGPKTIRVLVARVEPKRANALLKRLHTLLPTPEANVRAVSCDKDCVCAVEASLNQSSLESYHHAVA